MALLQSIDKVLTLDLAKPGLLHTVHAMQLDNGRRRLLVKLVNDGIPYTVPEGVSVKLQGAKPDGSSIFKDCSVDNDIIICELGSYELSVPGTCNCVISLYEKADDDSEYRLSSFSFKIDIPKNPFNSDVEVSATEISVLATLIAKVESATARVERVTSDAETLVETNRTLNDQLTESISNSNDATNTANEAAERANNAAQALEDLLEGEIPVATDTSVGGVKSGSPGDIHVDENGYMYVDSLPDDLMIKGIEQYELYADLPRPGNEETLYIVINDTDELTGQYYFDGSNYIKCSSNLVIVDIEKSGYEVLPEEKKNDGTLYNVYDEDDWLDEAHVHYNKDLLDGITPELVNGWGAPQIVGISQEDYDALSEEDKNKNIFYVIIDIPDEPLIMEISQENYDALSPTEKNRSIFYVITDEVEPIVEYETENIDFSTDIWD